MSKEKWNSDVVWYIEAKWLVVMMIYKGVYHHSRLAKRRGRSKGDGGAECDVDIILNCSLAYFSGAAGCSN